MKPQTAQILDALKRTSLTPGDAMRLKPPCYRLSARVLELRRAGYDVEKIIEPHDGGHHARYRLAQ